MVLRLRSQGLSRGFNALVAAREVSQRDLEGLRRGLVLLLSRELGSAWRAWQGLTGCLAWLAFAGVT